MKRRHLLLTIAIALSPARALADCASHTSTCIDADTFWPRPGPSTFTFVGSAETTARGQFGLGMVVSYLRRPVVLVAPSTDPAGLRIDAVDHVVDTTYLWSYGVADRADLFAALPTTVYQTGSGASALAAQTTQDMPHTVLRDARLGVSYALTSREPPFGAAARLEIALPTGDEQSFAGDRSVVGIPSFAADFRRGPWLLAAEVGARLRRTANLLGARVGSQLWLGLGAGVHVVQPQTLSVLVEAFALPTFAEQRREAYDFAQRTYVEWSRGQPLVPAEWALSIRSVPVPNGDFSIALAGGGRLPLTSDPGITTPVYRFSLVLRYAPVTR